MAIAVQLSIFAKHHLLITIHYSTLKQQTVFPHLESLSPIRYTI